MDFSIKAIFYCIFRNSGLPDKLSCFLFGFLGNSSYIVGWLGGSSNTGLADTEINEKKVRYSLVIWIIFRILVV